MNEQESEMKTTGDARRDGLAVVAMFVLTVLFVVWIVANIV